MRTGIPLLALSLLLFPAVLAAQQGSAADEKAIREIEARWEAAWNRHDVPAMVRDFAPDVDVVNLSGAWMKGRDRFAASLTEMHQGRVKESVWKMDEIDVKFLTPEIAVVHAYWNARGERNPDGSPLPLRRGLYTRVEVKRGGQWVIVASHATEVVPPSPAAGAPPGAAPR
jgi:uncharacterized protein (TIGR02246 family)